MEDSTMAKKKSKKRLLRQDALKRWAIAEPGLTADQGKDSIEVTN
jgi:hypothetical protein